MPVGDTSNFQDRLAQIRDRMAAACRRVGRPDDDVSLVAVAKTFAPEDVREAAAAGVHVFGENKVQEAAAKIPLCPSRLQWHLVGHLQTNKVRQAVSLFRMMHAVDSWRLLEAVDQACGQAGRQMPVLLEVNVSGERSKFGLPPADVPAMLARTQQLYHVSVVGLMTMPPFSPDAEASRPFFRKLRLLRDEWRVQTGIELPHLSMGMSNDFEVAIEECATWIRVGTALFGERRGRQWRPASGVIMDD